MEIWKKTGGRPIVFADQIFFKLKKAYLLGTVKLNVGSLNYSEGIFKWLPEYHFLMGAKKKGQL